uniref:Pheromone-binding protein 3 n=2 Tax=Ectropis TaxID=248898 RepID=A0A1L2BLD6_ECTOB|nr:pheromone-binding protein 3 [Ectropis obliqua]
MWWKLVFVVVVGSAVVGTTEAADAMKLLASGFISVLEICQKELNIEDGLISDLYHYWKLEFSMMQRDTGCALICMTKKLELLTDDGKFHHGVTKEFAMKNGADDNLATEMVSIIHSCETKSEGLDDECLRALEVAKCFRVALHDLHWEPSPDVVITEVLGEM